MTSGYKPEPTGATPPKTVPDQGSSIAPPNCPHTEFSITLGSGPHRLFGAVGHTLAWAEDSIREFGTNPGVHPLAHPVARTVQGLIIQATNAKAQAMAWQQRIATNGGYPYSQTYAQECADWWQARLVHLLTLIIAGDETTLAAQGGKP